MEAAEGIVGARGITTEIAEIAEIRKLESPQR
jgi:hypothetical protein